MSLRLAGLGLSASPVPPPRGQVLVYICHVRGAEVTRLKLSAKRVHGMVGDGDSADRSRSPNLVLTTTQLQFAIKRKNLAEPAIALVYGLVAPATFVKPAAT